MGTMFPISFLGFLVRIDVALAQSGIGQAPIKPPSSVGIASGGIMPIVCSGLRWIFTAAILLSIVMVLVAAFEYLRAGGDPGKVKTANNRLIFVAIGIAVAILARTLPVLVGSIVGADASSTNTSSLCPSR